MPLTRQPRTSKSTNEGIVVLERVEDSERTHDEFVLLNTQALPASLLRNRLSQLPREVSTLPALNLKSIEPLGCQNLCVIRMDNYTQGILENGQVAGIV